MKTVDFYMTDWGAFPMPDGLAKRTRWRYVYGATYMGRRVVKEPEPTPDNHEFFAWLHAEELKAGKPNAGGVSEQA